MEFSIVKETWKREKETRRRLKKSQYSALWNDAGRWLAGTGARHRQKAGGSQAALLLRQQARVLVAVEGAQSSQCQDLCVSGHWEMKLHLKGTDIWGQDRREGDCFPRVQGSVLST